MRRTAAILFGIFCAGAGAMAQLVPASPAADFGEIREAEGPKTLRIYMRNEGTGPEAILKVRPTCGCTAADFMKDPVAPGDSAWIDLTYDPSRRPGRFEKGVKIYPVDGEMVRLPVTGVVFASAETIGSMFPVDGGLLHLSESTLMTLSPLGSESRTLWLDAYNSGETPVRIRLEGDHEALGSQTFPPVVAPGEKGMVAVYIDPVKENRTGRLEYTLKLEQEAEGHEPTQFEVKIYSEKP